jgi:hypothetical protein
MDLPTLPSGILSYDNLAWSQKTWYKKTFHVATIPLNRFADFVEGEGKKADASFALIRTKANVEKVHTNSQLTHHICILCLKILL